MTKRHFSLYLDLGLKNNILFVHSQPSTCDWEGAIESDGRIRHSFSAEYSAVSQERGQLFGV